MTEQREPTRWCDDPGGLPSELVQAMRGYRSQGPAEAERARMRAVLEQRLVATPLPKPRPPLDLRRLGGVLGLALGLVAVVWRAWPPDEPVAPLATQPAAPHEVEHAPALTPGRVGPAVAPPPAEALQQTPPAAPAARSHRAERRRAHRRPLDAAPAAADPGVELELLRRARRLLDADPARALALTDEHAQRFAQGMFVQERELIAIEALVRDARLAQARVRAARFGKLYPSSVHLERLRVLLGPL